MSLKIFEASRRLAAITAQFTAAGLDIEQFIAAADETALKAHLESLKGNPSRVAELEAQLQQTKAAYAHAVASLEANVTALAAVGITPKASDEKAGLTAADIETAIRDRASVMASDQLAKHNLKDPLSVTPSADVTKPAAKEQPTLTGFKRVLAAFKSQPAA